MTRHLYAFFPGLEGKDVMVEASTVADVVREMEKIAPGFAFYVCDELGRLRRHVNIFVEEERICRPPVVDRPGRRGFARLHHAGAQWRLNASSYASGGVPCLIASWLARARARFS